MQTDRTFRAFRGSERDQRASPSRCKTSTPIFKSIEYMSFGKVDVVRTTLDRDCADFTHLVGKFVELDGLNFRCRSVIEHPPRPPYRKGDSICLIIDMPDAKDEPGGRE